MKLIFDRLAFYPNRNIADFLLIKIRLVNVDEETIETKQLNPLRHTYYHNELYKFKCVLWAQITLLLPPDTYSGGRWIKDSLLSIHQCDYKHHMIMIGCFYHPIWHHQDWSRLLCLRKSKMQCRQKETNHANVGWEKAFVKSKKSFIFNSLHQTGNGTPVDEWSAIFIVRLVHYPGLYEVSRGTEYSCHYSGAATEIQCIDM